MEKRKILIDTDPGIDDAFAILTAMAYEPFEIVAITTVSGNKSLPIVTPNALRLVDFKKRDIEVAEGASCRWRDRLHPKAAVNDGGAFHGADGMGGSGLPYSTRCLSSQKAWDLMLKKIRAYPCEIELIALGPLTNLAYAIEQDADTMKKLKSLTIMGGSFKRPGNVTQTSEFNLWFDPEAADLVMRNLGNQIPITFVGLDATHSCRLTHDDMAFLGYEGGEQGALMEKMIRPYMASYWHQSHILGVVIHDLYTVLALMDPSIITAQDEVCVEIGLNSDNAGQTCLVSGVPNATAVMALSSSAVRQCFFKTIMPEKKALIEEIFAGVC